MSRWKGGGNHMEIHLRLKVSPSSGPNWTVKGEWYTFDNRGASKQHSISGTLFAATGRLALKFTFPKEIVDKGRIDGTFQPSTGFMQMKLWVPVDAKGRKLALLTYDCENKASKTDLETVWVLVGGGPVRTKEYTEELAKTVVIDPAGGTMTWQNYSLKEGKPIDQVMTFYVPKSEYRYGEKIPIFVSAKGTDHDAKPQAMVFLRYGWEGGGSGVISLDSGHGYFVESKGWEWKYELAWTPPLAAKAYFAIAQPVNCYLWTYEPRQRPKKAAAPPPTKPVEKPADKPATTAGSTPKSPTLRVISVKGDVQVKHQNSTDWVDFDPAVPLKVGDTISTGQEEEIELALPDGETLRLDPGSTIKVGPLLEARGQRTRAIMDMIAGRVFVRRIPGPGDITRSSFEIRRPTATISVRGTEYSVSWDDESKMLQVHVTEGEVSIAIKGETSPIVLKPGETWVRKFPD